MRLLQPIAPALAWLALLAASALPAAGSWQEGFYINGLNGTAHDALVYDDGSGPALYLGGEMVAADGVVVNYLARWDGTRMTSVGGGFNAPVRALAAFDDGSGMALYAGGDFSQAGGKPVLGIARWDGQGWAAVGEDITRVYDLHVWDDGDGPALYAAGNTLLVLPPNVITPGIGKWTGSEWVPVGFGLRGGQAAGYALTDFDDGNGSALYVAGNFNHVANGPSSEDEIGANNVGRWDGELWSAVGRGLVTPAKALAVFDFGAGPRLVAGGGLFDITPTIFGVAQWDGNAWSQGGSGLSGGEVLDFLIFDDGSGATLYASGDFDVLAAQLGERHGLARWQRGEWMQVGQGLQDGSSGGAMAAVAFGPDPGLYIGGTFSLVAGSQSSYGLARWDGTVLEPFTGAPIGLGTDREIYHLAGEPGAFGGALFAGGSFSRVGSLEASGIARLAAGQWFGVGGGVLLSQTGVTSLEIFGGTDLIAAGPFANAGGVPALNGLARWDGTSWHSMGDGINGFEDIDTLLATDLPDAPAGLDGPRLWLGGDFSDLAEVPGTLNIASWDGTAFSALDAGVGTESNISPVRALTAFDDGNGMAIYAGGTFTTASGDAVNRFARWDGSSWSAVGAGFNGQVRALATHDDGNGPALYAAGTFTQVDGEPISGLARWDGQQWSSVGGVDFTMSGANDNVDVFATFDDGTGPKLAIGGHFQGPLGPGYHTLVFWDGTSFSAPVGGQPNGRVRTLLVQETSEGRKLYAGGRFSSAGGVPSANIAVYALPLLFADGFESGDTAAWSAATP